MLTFEQMFVRLVAALVLGSILGIERELVGKEAGVRTEMVVAAGAAIFTMTGLMLPYLLATGANSLTFVINNGGYLSLIGNIITGVGFLGAGLIIKSANHARGLTTAALVWFTAAIGVLVGVGLIWFASITTILIAFLLYFLRKLDITEQPLDPVKK
jgi:putative Mg2+ transporter-C (MgtC) family protein